MTTEKILYKQVVTLTVFSDSEAQPDLLDLIQDTLEDGDLQAHNSDDPPIVAVVIGQSTNNALYSESEFLEEIKKASHLLHVWALHGEHEGDEDAGLFPTEEEEDVRGLLTPEKDLGIRVIPNRLTHPEEHETLADLMLSGENILVGRLHDDDSSSVWIQTTENVEPIYLSKADVTLLRAALKLASSGV